MIKKIYFPWLTSITIALCLLTGCSQIPTTTQPSKPEINKPEYHKIANAYLKKALQTTKNEEIQEYKLKATENFILAEEIDRATELSNNIEITTQSHESYLYILKAQIALHKKQLALAQQALQNIWTPKQLPSELQAKFYQTRANLYLRSENHVEAAKDNIAQEQLLTRPEEKKYKDKEIWTILSKLTPNTLQTLQQNSDDSNFKGWVSFTHIMKQYDTNPEQMARAITIWKRNYPEHPANNILPEQENSHEQAIALEQPKKIALLLPLTGPYATSAEIIRDGFLAAHYEQIKINDSKTEVHIYDTTTSNGVTQAYRKAIDDNSDFIVGPLIKDEVETVAAISNKSIPILALNTTPTTLHSHYSNLFQFGLLPETDVTELAEQVWHDGHRRVLVIVPVGDWGQRIATAFRTSWEQHDGRILAIEKITPKEDLSKKMRRILAVENSEQRLQKLKKAGVKFKAEPRRRQDIDAIVIATNAILARQLKPLLNFYYAGDIPVYAHSAIYNGQPAPIQDQDLNGITFCDMPWLLDSTIASKSIYKNILKLWPAKLIQSPRLFAFGIDAYKIANQVHQLKLLPDFGISGMTGILTLDDNQKIQRKLIWAKFYDGLPKLLATK